MSLSKKSAFSCDQCRKRKVRCGGEQPFCKRCVAREETCEYKLPPTLSYTQKLESRVEELERLVSQLQIPPAKESSGSPQPGSPKPRSGLPPVSFEGLKFDNQGSITYHGATSFFHLPNAASDKPSTGIVSDDPSASLDGERIRQKLVSNAWHQRALETFAETPEPFQFLLKTHWCWIQPLFNFVYRPAFTRDMEVSGPYYSHALLNTMLSHSIRWCKKSQISHLLVPYEDGEVFSRQARTLLFDELRTGQSRIPTVQTLLLLSAQECSYGNRTQAWLYSGMAFRLIEDLGICIDGQKYAGSVRLSDEDIEIRRRVFWSCYFWDKMISLYLGRSPTLQHSNVSPPQIMLDDSAETELWSPHGIVYPEGMEYAPTQAHSISCFVRMCQLSEIFNQILIHIYDPLQENSEDEIQNCIMVEGEALKSWWKDLPNFLRIDPREMPLQCPPSHIVTLNCLYHTFTILLYRPMLFQRSEVTDQKPDPNHLVECISSATSIIAIFDLFCKTFGDNYCILSLSYSVYTAASIFLLQIQAGMSRDEQTLARLKFSIYSLERVKSTNPVITSALDLITKALSKLDIDLSGLAIHSLTPTDYTPPVQGEFLPLLPDPVPIVPQVGADGNLQDAYIYNFNPDNFEVTKEMLEAFSSLEPVDATVSRLW
ncbi:hypothetical protein V501_06851 [Pseudogymnoascus sp. VKM F-4519 (FW-2642)]|nr:hypothetical protein V501_06851 [Pseudogymnoascus sp. VKM F-4519 (FW-2642)]